MSTGSAPTPSESAGVADACRGTVMTVMCGGHRCAALGSSVRDASDDRGSLRDRVRAAVRGSRGGVLVRTERCMGPCALAPIVAVAPIRGDGTVGTAVAMGPMADATDITAFVRFVESGARHLPKRLARLVVRASRR